MWEWDRFASQSDTVNEHTTFNRHKRHCYTAYKPVIERSSQSRNELADTSAVGHYRLRERCTLDGLGPGVENHSVHGKRTRRRSG